MGKRLQSFSYHLPLAGGWYDGYLHCGTAMNPNELLMLLFAQFSALPAAPEPLYEQLYVSEENWLIRQTLTNIDKAASAA